MEGTFELRPVSRERVISIPGELEEKGERRKEKGETGGHSLIWPIQACAAEHKVLSIKQDIEFYY